MSAANDTMNDGSATQPTQWKAGRVPVAVVMISLNEGHNLEQVCENLKGWAQEVWLVDSYSKDDTIDIALRHGVRVVQRKFRGFGDQWNFAVRDLPIGAAWTMKLDPDERLSDQLKADIESTIAAGSCDGIAVHRRLWFMGRPLPVAHSLLRVWRTGTCRFTDVSVNEHPIVEGNIAALRSELEHFDSPSLEHWIYKQNRYTTDEAAIRYLALNLADKPRLFGTAFQRRMWLKKNFYRLPFRYALYFLYLMFVEGAWRAGRTGRIWAHLRTDVFRSIEFKTVEMQTLGKQPPRMVFGAGAPDARVRQIDL
jgi:glycosyltransferase involved in cell wall biosynthesis